MQDDGTTLALPTRGEAGTGVAYARWACAFTLLCGRSTVPSSSEVSACGRTRPTPRKGTHDHHEGTPSHRFRSSPSSGSYPHRTRGGGSALPGGVWPPEVSVPPHGPAVHAGLQAGLPRERRADGAGHMRARMHDHVPVRQDRLPVGSRHVSGQLPAALATARAAAERLPRQLRPGASGVRKGRGGASEDLRCRLSHGIGSAGLLQGVHRYGQAGWCGVWGRLPDLRRELR